MGAGKLKTKQYKIRRGGRGWIGWLAAGALAAALFALYTGIVPLPAPGIALSPAPTLTPRDGEADTRLITLPGGAWYALQLGAFDRAEAAQSLAEAYRGRGAGGLIWQRDGVYRVLAAAYESRSDAQAVQSQLRAQHGVETVVTDIVWPEITLRVTGQKAQLDALSDAYDALAKITKHLSDLSRALDQGETDREKALHALQSERDTAAALNNRLNALFSPDIHPAVRDMGETLGEAARALENALNAAGNTKLGAQIKYCQLLCVCRMASHAQGLAP